MAKQLPINGFTIIELLITITMFAILIPIIASLMTTISSTNDRAKDLAIVNALVENKVESLRSKSFTGISNGSVDFTDELPDTVAAPRSADYTITSVGGTTALKQLDITITFSDYGRTRTLNYRTYIGELGVGQY